MRPSRKPMLRRSGLCAAALWLLLASVAQGTQHFIFSNTCTSSSPDCNAGDPCMEINASTEATLNDTIEPANFVNPVTFKFDIPPSGPGCAGGGSVFTCNGVTIDASGIPVTVSGNPTAGGSFSFSLQAKEGMTELPCYRGFELLIKDPFNLVLVLDRSGSMSASTHILPPASNRWDALKRAVNGFTPIVETSGCSADSRFGLTLFSTNVIPNMSFPAGLRAVSGLPDLSTAVTSELNGQSPDGLTALGRGLQDGIGKLDNPGRKRVVMVFSDGEQNQFPKVNHSTGTTYLDSPPIDPPTPIAPGGTGAFKIVTVGIGAPMNDYLAALQNLAMAHGGVFHVTQTGEDLSGALDMATQSLLDGCSPQMVASYRGTLAGPVTLPAFDVNRKVSQLLIKISYDRRFESTQLAQLLAGIRITKDGADVTQFFQPIPIGGAANAVILRTASIVPPEGSYSIAMQPMQQAGGQTAPGFRVVVFADDERLDMDWRVSPTEPRVDEPFQPTMKLSRFNRPLTGATVEALILRPGDDLGDLLARDPRRVDPSSASDAGSPGYQKYLELLQDPAFLAKLLPAEQRLTLTHQGDGVYSAAYDPGDVSGVYQILYEVKLDDPGAGGVQRQALQSVYVRPGAIDLAASAVTTTVRDGFVFIDFRPRTTNGRLIGPANASALSVTGAGVTVDGITDHQDGSYTMTLAGDPGADVSVSFLDDEIYHGPAEEFGPGGGSSRFAWSLHAGITDPDSGFASGVSGGVLVEADLEMALSSRFSLNLVLGRYDFDPVPAIVGGTLYARSYLPVPGFRLFAELGAGLYDPDGLDVSWGVSGGLGVGRTLSGLWRGEAGIDLFHLFNDGDDLRFLAYKIGVRRAF